jgi:3-phenylpropionate/trans-cinnamate dioxygenase ferredoxin reductase component
MPDAPVVVIGASLAGLRAAEAMRGAGYDAEIVMVGAERYMPYTRPPLSKELLAGGREPAACTFDCESVEVTWRLGTAAARLDTAGKRVRLEHGDELPYSSLLLATGARARPWPVTHEAALDGVFLLRDVDDALALRTAFAGGPRVAIIGAGFIGCEVAATARKLGLDVTLVEMAAQPMPSLGPELGEHCAHLHREHGVDVRLGTGVKALRGEGRVEALHLSDDTEVPADVVLVALGAIPNTEWLRDSGLQLQPGVVCDATLAAAGAEDAFCAGDIVAWPHPLADGETVRIEHWTVAAEQGTAAGRNLVVAPDERRPFTATPYFWSDQYDVKIQSVGFPARATRMRIAERAEDGRRFVAVGDRDGSFVAAVGFNAARRMPLYRRELAARPPVDDVLAKVAADERSLGRAAAALSPSAT